MENCGVIGKGPRKRPARKLFRGYGLRGIGVDAIAEAAGTNKNDDVPPFPVEGTIGGRLFAAGHRQKPRPFGGAFESDYPGDPLSQLRAGRTMSPHHRMGERYSDRRDLAHERHHHHRKCEAHRNRQVSVSESLDLRFPVCEQPEVLERCGLAAYGSPMDWAYRAVIPCSRLISSLLAEVRCSAIRRKCRLVRSLSRMPHPAIPIAPPKHRIKANRPLADGTRSGAAPPRASVVVDASANATATPRKASGVSISCHCH